MRLEKIISGGQTGVDRAGLDAAIEAGIPSETVVCSEYHTASCSGAIPIAAASFTRVAFLNF